MIVSDNGTQLTSRALLREINRIGTMGHYIAPESLSKCLCRELHGRFRDECRNKEVFAGLAEP